MHFWQPQSFIGSGGLVETTSFESFSLNILLSFLIFYSTIEVLLQGYLKQCQRSGAYFFKGCGRHFPGGIKNWKGKEVESSPAS